MIYLLIILQTVLLSWDANQEPDLKGYKIHFGYSISNINQYILDVGNVTEYMTVSLDSSVKYWAVSAYDSAGNESALSNVVFIDRRYPIQTNLYLAPPAWVTSDVIGLLLDDNRIYFGSYNKNHNYTLFYTGAGDSIGFKIMDDYYLDNYGGLNIRIEGYDEFEVLPIDSTFYNNVIIPVGETIKIIISGTFVYWGSKGLKADAGFVEIE